jgi:hypothetical protein
MTELRNVNVKADDSPSIDAFARWRVSNPVTIFDSKQIFDDGDIADSAEQYPLLYDNQETSGSGTSTAYDNDTASTTLSVGATTAGMRVRQTKMRFNYQPGKSQLVFLTFVMGSQDSGITKREGLFDGDNGLFLEDNGSNYGFVRRTYVTGSAVDNRVAQSSWNLDTMDGSGDSGITLDFTKTQILVIDFEWLGVGRVRMGFVVDGMIYYAHEFLNANSLANVYMSTPNLPLRTEIVNDGTGVAADLIKICSSVISEGGQEKNGALHSVNNETTGITVGATKEVILAIQLRSTHLGLSVDLETLNILQTANAVALWELQYNPTLSAALSYSNVDNSGLQSAVGGGETVTTDGYVVASGYIAGTNQMTNIVSAELQNAIRLGSEIDGTVDQLVLVAVLIDGSPEVYASLQWRELA